MPITKRIYSDATDIHSSRVATIEIPANQAGRSDVLRVNDMLTLCFKVSQSEFLKRSLFRHIDRFQFDLERLKCKSRRGSNLSPQCADRGGEDPRRIEDEKIGSCENPVERESGPSDHNVFVWKFSWNLNLFLILLSVTYFYFCISYVYEYYWQLPRLWISQKNAMKTWLKYANCQCKSKVFFYLFYRRRMDSMIDENKTIRYCVALGPKGSEVYCELRRLPSSGKKHQQHCIS